MLAQKDGGFRFCVEEESVFKMVDEGVGENPPLIIEEKRVKAMMEREPIHMIGANGVKQAGCVFAAD
jgi:hypothetical protein